MCLLLLIGGDGERCMLRIVVEYVDVWNIGFGEIGMFCYKFDVFVCYCVDVGCDLVEIRKSLIFWVVFVESEVVLVACRREVVLLLDMLSFVFVIFE